MIAKLHDRGCRVLRHEVPQHDVSLFLTQSRARQIEHERAVGLVGIRLVVEGHAPLLPLHVPPLRLDARRIRKPTDAHLARVLRLRRLGKDEFPHFRIAPISTDHDVVAVDATRREGDLHGILGLDDLIDRRTGQQARTQLRRAVDQRRRQRGAVHADGHQPAGRNIRLRRRQHERAAVRRVHPGCGKPRLAVGRDLFVNTQLGERIGRTPRDTHAGTDRAELIREFDDIDVDTDLLERDRGGEPRDPAADDESP